MNLNKLGKLFAVLVVVVSACQKNNFDTTHILEDNADPQVTTILCDSFVTIIQSTISAGAAGLQAVDINNKGVAPITYVWSTGETTASIQVAASGDYSVTMTDANGCSDQATVNIVIPNSNSCDGFAVEVTNEGSNTLKANITGGSAPFMYQWSNGASASSFNYVTNGTFTVTVTDVNGCTASDDFVVVNNPCAGFSASFAQVDNTLSVQVAGGSSPYQYYWNNGANTSSVQFNPNSGKNYGVTVSDANNCSQWISYPVAPGPCSGFYSNIEIIHIASASSAKIHTTGGVAPFIYLWSTGATSQEIPVATGTSYIVTVTDAAGCYDIRYLNL